MGNASRIIERKMQREKEKTLNSAGLAPQSDRLKVFVATPHAGDVEPCYVHSIAQMFTAMPAEYNYEVFENALLSEGRTDMLKQAAAWGADYLFFLDTDMEFPPDVLKRLIALKRDVATGVYYKRISPHAPVLYDFVPSGRVRNMTTLPDKPFRVGACGAGCLLISKKVITALAARDTIMAPGLFLDRHFGQAFHHIGFINDETNEPEQLSEDVSFCHRAKALGFEIWADPGIRVGHSARLTIYKEHFDAMHKAELAVDKRSDGEPDGWMSHEELEFLRHAASLSESVVEIGSWKGRSTKALLEGCKGPVWAVDHFKGSEDYNDSTLVIAREEPVFEIFKKNVGHYPNLRILQMDSAYAASMIPDGSVDMAFIDSDHRYEQVKAEIKRWLPKARFIVALHDYCDEWPGVKQAVEESFEKFHVVGTIAFARVGEKELLGPAL